MGSQPLKVSVIFGTRPEAIKLCPLILALRAYPDRFAVHVCVTGQHRQMLDQVLEVFDVIPDTDLAIMQPNQSLAALTSRALAAVDRYLAERSPDLVVVQGDTTTVFTAALAAFFRRIRVAHVEAGLRTWNRFSPFPEEISRVFVSRLADHHFAPTEGAKNNLLREGVEERTVAITGNTVIDALQIALRKVKAAPPLILGLPKEIMGNRKKPLVLITGHRRENFGSGMESICGAIATLAARFEDVEFVYPVHLNPNVREPVFRMLGCRPNVHLIEPLPYLPFVALMQRSTLILTDSGGVQEEAPSMGKPVLVMRDTTERPEGVEAGTIRLVGSDETRIVEGVSELLTDQKLYKHMSGARNPYGDGKACERIVELLSSRQ
ncbi:MAG TPA: UDP-N-acetylglucosamine 2-epimerase (non-hydrolyzing) [Tepidisphaeraceae bacterium]|nr:UDP-N-acetylglucosamine 2-epimerase (non-hydrolyzing) [Tepidisphaeraceae bacterium]